MPDDAFEEKVREVMQESQQQLLLEMNSLIQPISDQNANSNEKQLLKISSLVATTGMPKFKRKSNEQFKLNSHVLLKLDETEQSMESSNIDKSKEKSVEGKKVIFFQRLYKKKEKKEKSSSRRSEWSFLCSMLCGSIDT